MSLNEAKGLRLDQLNQSQIRRLDDLVKKVLGCQSPVSDEQAIQLLADGLGCEVHEIDEMLNVEANAPYGLPTNASAAQRCAAVTVAAAKELGLPSTSARAEVEEAARRFMAARYGYSERSTWSQISQIGKEEIIKFAPDHEESGVGMALAEVIYIRLADPFIDGFPPTDDFLEKEDEE